MNKQIILGGLVFLLVASGSAYAIYTQSYRAVPVVGTDTMATSTDGSTTTTTTTIVTPPTTSTTKAYGNVTLALMERGVFKNITISPTTLLGDSRCPVKVQCIQAGNVRVALSITTGGKTSVVNMATGETINKDGFVITFISTTPAKVADMQEADVDYKFTFSVTPETAATAPCYIGGCSSEICSDKQGVASTCIYREEYVCYKSASCTRQTNGSCGWTQTPSLKACLINPAPTL